RISFCLLAIVAMIYVGHYLFHILFPIERAAMYFFPLFVLQLAHLADGTAVRWLRRGLSVLLLAYTVTAAWGLNRTHMCISTVMADIPALIQDLTRIHQKNSQPVELCMSDGTKWQVWYYAELATQVPESERLQDHECFARIDWLYVYEAHCGLPAEKGRLFTATTTHLFLSSDDYPPTWFLHDTALVREYPVSHWRLYSRTEETVARDEDILRMKPDFADGHYSLGDALMREGKNEEAIAQFEQALRIKPDFAEAHSDLGVVLAQTGKIEEAIAQFEQALRIKPDYAVAHYNLGFALAQTGKIEEAITHYQQALRTEPDDADVHYNLANALSKLGQTAEAVAQFQETLRINPDYAEAHYNLGNALAQSGRAPEAKVQYEQALRIKPDFTAAADALARLQARQ
ncbi:MAG: tetratricopeptide repeat protein, partial [Verrucomicrobiia bacterium]